MQPKGLLHPLRVMPSVGAQVMVNPIPRVGGVVMARPFKGVVNIDIKDSVPDWEPYTQPTAPEGAPNVVYVVLDDVGFSAMEPYGGLIETPNIKRIAERGLSYTSFHTTALCSPTRSALLTGRNHTTNGMGCITEATSGFPNANGHIPFECANIAEVLNDRGWNTYHVGKWHLCAEDEMNLASSKRQWPLGRAQVLSVEATPFHKVVRQCISVPHQRQVSDFSPR